MITDVNNIGAVPQWWIIGDKTKLEALLSGQNKKEGQALLSGDDAYLHWVSTIAAQW